jgi:hypothetical protein
MSSKKFRRRFSESSALSATSCEPATPSTPLTPFTATAFNFDDVFDEPAAGHCAKATQNAMNFDEMSNCLTTLMEHRHSSISGDNAVSSLQSIGNGFKQSDNNYDSIINYCDENEFGIVYF